MHSARSANHITYKHITTLIVYTETLNYKANDMETKKKTKKSTHTQRES